MIDVEDQFLKNLISKFRLEVLSSDLITLYLGNIGIKAKFFFKLNLNTALSIN